MIKKLAIRGGLALLGMGATLAWWTLHPGDSNTKSADHIPAKVWAGGNTLDIEVDSSSAATMRVSFTDHEKPAGSQPTLETWEKIPAGARSWSIDVPSGVGGYIEIEADKPNAGDKLTMRVKMNGHSVDEQSEKLEGALQPGTAFFVQDHFDDYSKAMEDVGESAGEKSEQ
jgi:hypothetical protein